MKQLAKGIPCVVVLSAAMVFSATVLAQKQLDNEPDTKIDAKTRKEVIDTLAKDLQDAYVIPDTGEALAEMLKERQSNGRYNSIASAKEFAQLLTKEINEIAHDRHMSVRYSANEMPLDTAIEQSWKKKNYFFEEIRCLDGNIGYFKFNHVYAAEAAGPIVAGAMAFLFNTDAMILDLRQNHGGDPEMVQFIASYFFSGDKPVHLNDIEFRKAGTVGYTTPEQSWTLPYVPGQRYLGKEVYVLTSHHTFSGGEELTYDLQTQKRATIVGETTGGGANPPEELRIAKNFYARIPYGRAVNPVTKTNWEGVGVKPDIETASDDALLVAQKSALEHLIAKTADKLDRETLTRALESVETEMRERKKPTL